MGSGIRENLFSNPSEVTCHLTNALDELFFFSLITMGLIIVLSQEVVRCEQEAWLRSWCIISALVCDMLSFCLTY